VCFCQESCQNNLKEGALEFESTWSILSLATRSPSGLTSCTRESEFKQPASRKDAVHIIGCLGNGLSSERIVIYQRTAKKTTTNTICLLIVAEQYSPRPCSWSSPSRESAPPSEDPCIISREMIGERRHEANLITNRKKHTTLKHMPSLRFVYLNNSNQL
jgi:hypothetical protein